VKNILYFPSLVSFLESFLEKKFQGKEGGRHWSLVQHENWSTTYREVHAPGLGWDGLGWAGFFYHQLCDIKNLGDFFFSKLVEFPLENTKISSTQLKKFVEKKQLLSYAPWVIN
jgi:hypothetical protein